MLKVKKSRVFNKFSKSNMTVVIGLKCSESCRRPGKVHSSLILSPSERLFQFLEDVSFRHPSWNSDENISKWKGVECTSDGIIHALRWSSLYPASSKRLEGNPNWRALPDSLGILDVSHNALSGEVAAWWLPKGLRHLQLDANQFHGSFDFTRLPQPLEFLSISGNRFRLAVDLTSLPVGLTHLDISSNYFNGYPSFRNLPRQLETLNVSRNKFYGKLDLALLPASLRSVSFYSNQFDAEVNFLQAPPELRCLRLDKDYLIASPAENARAMSRSSTKRQRATTPMWAIGLGAVGLGFPLLYIMLTNVNW